MEPGKQTVKGGIKSKEVRNRKLFLFRVAIMQCNAKESGRELEMEWGSLLTSCDY